MPEQPPRARDLARNALTLQRTHARAVGEALEPIRAALGTGPESDARLLRAQIPCHARTVGVVTAYQRCTVTARS